MPRNAKEGLIFGACFCVIMVFFMGLINISAHMGEFSKTAVLTNLKAFPVTFIIAFAIENIIVGPVNSRLLRRFTKETDSLNAKILFNCFFIVTMMSFIMTYVGGMLGGESLSIISVEFFARWPKNFWAAFFLNIIIAGPISRLVLKQIQKQSISTITD